MNLLTEKLAIAELVNRYFAALDDRHFDLATMRTLFAEDARMVRPNGVVTVGPEAIGESHARSMSRFRATQHLTSGFLVDFSEDGKTATVRANFVAIHLWAEGYGEPDVAPDENCFVAGGVLTVRVSSGTQGWRITEISSRPTWRRGVGFKEMLETK